MIINLIEPERMYSLTLPNKVKGQYWVTDEIISSEGNFVKRKMVCIEAVGDSWCVKSNKDTYLCDANGTPIKETLITDGSLVYIKNRFENNLFILYCEPANEETLKFNKKVISGAGRISIGRGAENNFRYANHFVSGNHAVITFDGKNWQIEDCGSTNGTYVNGYRVSRTELAYGDLVFIMGLRIIVGKNIISYNLSDDILYVNSAILNDFIPQPVENKEIIEDNQEEFVFSRAPRFYREFSSEKLSIDPPPANQDIDSVPLALMLGPSITMGVTSLCTGLLMFSNALQSNGNVRMALPSLIMAGSMLLGAVLWPVLTKGREKKLKRKAEADRQEQYFLYLEKIRDKIRRIGNEQKTILEENVLSLDNCYRRIIGMESDLWERTYGQNDFLNLKVGTGEVPIDVEIKCKDETFSIEVDNLMDAMYAICEEKHVIPDAPLSVSLYDRRKVGIFGEENLRTEILASLLLQIFALHGYDECKVIFLADEQNKERWGYLRLVPHLWSNDKNDRYFVTNEADARELSTLIEQQIISRKSSTYERNREKLPYYVIVSTNRKLWEKCDAISQLLSESEDLSCSLLFCEETMNDLPKEAETVISANSMECRLFDKKKTDEIGVAFVPENFDNISIEKAAVSLANIKLDVANKENMLPSMITFLEMNEVGKIEHLNVQSHWKDNNPVLSLQVPIGVDASGTKFYLDMHEKFHGPHGLIAGMTGSGKSEFIITLILSMAVNYHPDEVAFVLIDYKGGGLAGAFENEDRNMKLPHLAGTITNLDGAQVNRSLISIQSELRRRQKIFNEARKIVNEGTMDIYKYQQLRREGIVSEAVPHLFIIADEFAELKSQQPEFMQQLISAARIGRSLGVHLILATQKPSGVVDDQIWSNSKFRICLKVQDKSDSNDMIRCPDAAEISQTGRFYMQVGFNEFFAYGQSAWSGADYIPSDSVQKKNDESISIIDNLGHVLINAKPSSNIQKKANNIKQIVSTVQMLSNIAEEENISVRPLWLKPIPAFIYVDEVEKKYGYSEKKYVLNPCIGEYDDPFNQKQGIVTVPISEEGNCIIYGSSGNGKATFVTSLCYSLIKHHDASEVNIYIVDMGAETLTAFQSAPQVGDVILSYAEEKITNLFHMLENAIKERKALFSKFGGDYQSYCELSGNTVPNIVVIINNFIAFSEQCPDYSDTITLLSREGTKYGIYFVLTANTYSGIRYKTTQNFAIVMTTQLNDKSDYTSVFGKTGGVLPSKCKGRGLLKTDRVYEFQIAYCCDDANPLRFIESYAKFLAESSSIFAPEILTLPEEIDHKFFEKQHIGLEAVPVGIRKRDLLTQKIDLNKTFMYQVISRNIDDMSYFTNELAAILARRCKTVLLDIGSNIDEEMKYPEVTYETKNVEDRVVELFNEMVERNNTYKDNDMNVSSLDKYEEIVYLIYGVGDLKRRLSADGYDKFSALVEHAELNYKIRIIILDSASGISACGTSGWYKSKINPDDGIWIGDGFANQSQIRLPRIKQEFYKEVEPGMGYVVKNGAASLTKLYSLKNEGEE